MYLGRRAADISPGRSVLAAAVAADGCRSDGKGCELAGEAARSCVPVAQLSRMPGTGRFASTAATSPSAARPVGRRRRCGLWQSRRQGLPACRSGGAIQRSKRPICVAIPIALQASGFQTGCFAETPPAAAGRLPASLGSRIRSGVRPLHLVCCASVTSLMLCRLHSSSEQPEQPYYC